MLKLNRFRSWLPITAAALLAVSWPAAAQQRVPADPATTSQKAEFIGNLVSRSVSVSRIEASGDAAAMESLARARALVDQAKASLKGGAFEAANDKLDQALALVNREIRRLSSDEVHSAHEQEMYRRRLKAVNAFLSAYERVAKEGSNQAAASQAKTIRTLIGKAEGKARNGRHAAAIEDLDDAYTLARGDIRKMRQGKTMTRTLDFATAEEEYDYELGRNRSHFLLLQFALSEKTPVGSVVGRIEGNRETAEGLRSTAETKAAAGAHPEAIDMLNQSTNLLLKTIRMSGIFMPG